jgi:dTDP-L-rhamnose 4-epimerase
MAKSVLITGGAGFIGVNICRALLAEGHRLSVLDNFSQQVHNTNNGLPLDIRSHVHLIKEDIRNKTAVRQALNGIDTLIHLAAETGTGQSMYEIERYFSVNVQGTALLLDVLQNDEVGKNLDTLIVASSRAIYGEGCYQCSGHGTVFPEPRSLNRMLSGDFDLHCPKCGAIVMMAPTEESAPFQPLSIYGLTKQVQEQAMLMFAKTRGINGFSLRYQNVYGPGQSLKNPYTGILSIFSNLARQSQTIEVYEDGLESRDFIFVEDVAAATCRTVSYRGNFVGAINVGSGESVTVNTVAHEINNYFGGCSDVLITGKFRVGDIRHNVASMTKAQSVIKFVPSVSFKDGLRQFLAWVEKQPLEDSKAYQRSVVELQEHGLMMNRKD